jgi:peptidoglycan/LPS O-acetylase OafA/YrhL
METLPDAAPVGASLQRGDSSFVPLDHRRHLKGLDGIRGVAIVMVFAFHYYPRRPHDPLGLLASLGWLGVDLFFTLSGFLITGILYDTVSQPHFFRNFFARRALRLFPVYIVMVAVALTVIYLAGLRPTLWAIPFFVYGANIVEDLERNTGLGNIVQLGHLWSLALEEQFYLVWAPMVFLLRTRRRILWGCLAGSVFSVSLRWLWLIYPVNHYLPYFELPTRLDSLLAGGAVALMLRAKQPSAWLRTGRLYGLFAVCPAGLAVVIALAQTSYWRSGPMVGFGYFAATVGFAAVCALSIREGTWINRVGNLSWLRTLGRYSYGLYLWHLLPDRFYIHFLTWFEAICPAHYLARIVGFTALLAFNLGIAAISYHTVELTFLRMKKYFSYSDEQKAHVMQADQATTVNVA